MSDLVKQSGDNCSLFLRPSGSGIKTIRMRGNPVIVNIVPELLSVTPPSPDRMCRVASQPTPGGALHHASCDSSHPPLIPYNRSQSSHSHTARAAPGNSPCAQQAIRHSKL